MECSSTAEPASTISSGADVTERLVRSIETSTRPDGLFTSDQPSSSVPPGNVFPPAAGPLYRRETSRSQGEEASSAVTSAVSFNPDAQSSRINSTPASALNGLYPWSELHPEGALASAPRRLPPFPFTSGAPPTNSGDSSTFAIPMSSFVILDDAPNSVVSSISAMPSRSTAGLPSDNLSTSSSTIRPRLQVPFSEDVPLNLNEHTEGRMSQHEEYDDRFRIMYPLSHPSREGESLSST
jgi:hypothetical protein